MKNSNENITNQNNFIVYIHIRSDTNEPFYVGKGVSGREIRLCGRNQHWKNVVNKNKGKFEVKILFENLTEDEALLKEREIELELKSKGYILTNIIECGVKGGTNGMKHSDKTKQKQSEFWKQYYVKHPSPKKGIKMSKESSDKKSIAMKGKQCRLGVKDSEETKKKKSIAFKNRDIDWSYRNEKVKEKLTDKTIYHFYNTLTKEEFNGIRKDFYTKYSLNDGIVSQLINGKVLKHKNWIKI